MYIDRLVLIFIIGAYLLSPAMVEWWSLGGTAWLNPFIIWLILIAISYLVVTNRDTHDI